VCSRIADYLLNVFLAIMTFSYEVGIIPREEGLDIAKVIGKKIAQDML
jgi:hypothetical protein